MFRPCIDIHNNQVKQIVGSSLRDNKVNDLETNFISAKSASYYAQLYKKHQLFGGHIIMLDKYSQAEALLALKKFPQGLQIGGGMNLENAKYYLEQGASHIIFNSFIFENNSLSMESLRALVNLLGKDKIVLDLSCKKELDSYKIMLNRWQNYSNVVLNEETMEKLSHYCDEFLIHAVDIEGKKSGMDEELVQLLANYSPIKVTYAGGINSLGEVKKIKKINSKKLYFTIGSSLDIFGGDISFKKLMELI